MQVACLCVFAQSGESLSISNERYQISTSATVREGTGVAVKRLDNANANSQLLPEITIVYAKQNPNLKQTNADANRYPVCGWQKPGTQSVENNLFNAGALATYRATKVKTVSNNQLQFDFPNTPQGKLSLLVTLPSGTEAPLLEMQFTPRTDGWYSLGFTGLPARDTSGVRFLYQPMSWSWRRFPAKPFLTAEARSLTAASFVNTGAFTEGVAPDPSEIPYRYAKLNNSRFALALRDANSRVKPMLFAPVFGGEGSPMKKGATYSFKLRYVLHGGDWQAGMHHILYDIFKYRTERQNAVVSLNGTLENMIDFAMGPYGGWVDSLKAFDYRQDVVGSVKMVSALHALGVALTTGNREIYRHRALPLMEYAMSREKYLYAVSDTIVVQSPSHFLNGPCVEIGELAGLNEMTGGKTPAFRLEAERIFGKPRKLNLQTATGGDAWYDYLSKYRISRKPEDLAKARQGADQYLQTELAVYPTDFSGNSGLTDKQATFYTDFTPRLFDLLELYEETNDKRYLDAATVSARQMVLWLRSHPVTPDSLITVNEGGKVTGIMGKRYKINSYEHLPNFDNVTEIAVQQIPAWRTSLVGLPPEQPYTYVGNGPIMLTHHAAWLLRLAHLANDTLLRDAAYNAVIGRYVNFPGYYFTSFGTTVYQHPGYPLHDYYDIKYNAIFYNHVWPHIALLMDFLVSDAYYKSDGNIHFPSAYAPGYAYLTSKVYGHKGGTVFGNENVRLWLPAKAVQGANVALNHLFGLGEKDLYLVLMNTANKTVQSNLQLHPDIVPWNYGQTYQLTLYDAEGKTGTGEMRDGELSVSVPARGLIAIKVHGLRVDVPLQRQATTSTESMTNHKMFVRNETKIPALGITTGMRLSLVPQFSDAYIFVSATEKESKGVRLKYKLGNTDWQIVEDKYYPYEFSIHLPDPEQPLEYVLESTDIHGKTHTTQPVTLAHPAPPQ